MILFSNFKRMFDASIVRQQADAAGSTNPFSTGVSAGTITSQGCHACVCEELFAEVMARVIGVKNMCSDDVCRVEDFSAFRRRNRAISADYARIYLQPLGEAKRLKFAGGAAFGSTHVGFGMDLAAQNLASWGSRANAGEVDLMLPGNVNIGPDTNILPTDAQELGAWFLTGVTYRDTLVGLRRLVYGNLAIYMDLGAVLWFCQLHEQRFNYFRDGRIDEFLDCFDRFVTYVLSNHAHDHPVYGDQGSFGASTGGWLRDGLRAIADNRIGDSLSIIDHEQRTILQNFMYTLEGLGDDPARQELGVDSDFKSFMNALEKVNWGSDFGADVRFQGIRALFSALEEPFLLSDAIQMHGKWQMRPLADQPLAYPFDSDKHGDDFTDANVRTPWFKDVVRHFIKAERNDFDWPSGEGLPPLRRIVFGRGNGADIRDGRPNLTGILHSDLGFIRSMG